MAAIADALDRRFLTRAALSDEVGAARAAG
jgi:hypothetical protein